MSLLTLVAKIGSGVLIAGTAIAVPVVVINKSRSSAGNNLNQPTTWNFGPTSQNHQKLNLSAEEASRRGECFIIPTAKSNTEEKFLICTDANYYLYKSQGKSFEKVLKIEGPKKNKKLTVTLEKNSKAKTLDLSGNSWDNFPEDLDFKRNCHNVRLDGNIPALVCSRTSFHSTDYWSQTINLTVFKQT